MEQTVYADLYFFINFSMDFLCFYISSRFLGTRISALRTAVASAVGGIYAVLSLVWGLAGINAVLLDLLSCALMCAIAFGSLGRARRLPIYILVYVAVSMTLGGFMTALFNLLNRTSLGNVATDEDDLSVWVLAILAVISAVFTLMGTRYFRRKTSKKEVSVSVSFGGKSKNISALCDSGNMLRDPISGKLCVIVSLDAVRDILPRELIAFLNNGARDPDAALGTGVRVIPTVTAMGEGMLFALAPDSIFVDDGKDKYAVDAFLALSELSDFSGGAKALFPTELLA